eukprot:scaffold216212_cov32-Tisochrysis_lutea.AAC.1
MVAMWLCGFLGAARAVARARAHLGSVFGGASLVVARSAGAAEVTAGEEGSDSRSIIHDPIFLKLDEF